MAKLTSIDTKLAEVIGLAMAAQDATKKVEKMVDDSELAGQLETMRDEAAMAEKDGTDLAGELKGKKAAILREARSAKKKATSMMSDYLEKSSDALDGFEFLTMAEAGEVGHWSVLGEMAKTTRNGQVRTLVSKHLPIQKRHFKDVQAGSLKLAREEAQVETGASASSNGGGGSRSASSSGRKRTSTSRSRSSSGKSGSARKSTSRQPVPLLQARRVGRAAAHTRGSRGQLGRRAGARRKPARRSSPAPSRR